MTRGTQLAAVAVLLIGIMAGTGCDSDQRAVVGPIGPDADSQQALAGCLRLLAVDPHDAQAWLTMAGIHAGALADSETALACIARVLAEPTASATTQALALRQRGDIHSHAHRWDAARADYAQSLALAETVEVRRSLCHVAGYTGDHAEAARQAQRAWQLDARDPIAALLYATQLLRANRPDEAQRIYAIAAELADSDALLVPRDGSHGHCCVVYNGAGYWAVQGNHPRALDMLERFMRHPAHRHITRADLFSDPDFKALHTHPRFLAVAAQAPDDRTGR